jgi:hypothetical protein
MRLSVHSWASCFAKRVTSSDASAIAFAQSMRSLLEPPSPLHTSNTPIYEAVTSVKHGNRTARFDITRKSLEAWTDRLRSSNYNDTRITDETCKAMK